MQQCLVNIYMYVYNGMYVYVLCTCICVYTAHVYMCRQVYINLMCSGCLLHKYTGIVAILDYVLMRFILYMYIYLFPCPSHH